MSYKKREYGGRPPRRDFNSGPRETFPAKCADCGSDTQVPFKPVSDKPVYCPECYKNHRKPRY